MEENHRRFKEKNKTTNSNKVFIILTIIFAICFVIILALLIYKNSEYLSLEDKYDSIKKNSTGLNDLDSLVENIDSEATVYASADKKILIVEIPNYSDDTKKAKVDNIIKTVSDNLDNLPNSYSKFILLEKMNSDDSKDYYLYTSVYELPSMEEITDESMIYIDFVKFTTDALSSSSTSTSTDTSSTTSTENASNKGEDITLTAGNYVVGEDIKAGKYDAIAQSGKGNLFVRGTTSVNEMLGVTDSQYYIKNYNNITLKDGDTIEITSSLSVLFQAK